MKKFIAVLFFSTIGGYVMGSSPSLKEVPGMPNSYGDILSRNVFLADSFQNPLIGGDSSTFFNACQAPTVITISEVSWHQFRVDWEEIPGQGKTYFIRYKKVSDPDTSWTVASNYDIQYPAWTVIGLSADTDYEVQIASDCLTGPLNYSQSVNLKTHVAPACNPPITVNSSDIKQNSVKVNWASVNEVTHHRIRYKKIMDSEWTETISSANYNNFELLGLFADTEYEVQIASRCDGGNEGAFSASHNFKTGVPVCESPSMIHVGSITQNAAQVLWMWPNQAQSFVVRYKKVSEQMWAETAIDKTDINLDNLVADTEYEVQIASVCSGNQGAFSTSVTFKTIANVTPVCNAPTTINTLRITSSSAYVNWTNVSTAYAFRYRKVGEAVWETVTPFHNSATLDNLSPDTEYEVQVASICEGVQGSFSTSKPFKTNAAPVCNAPTTINTLRITSISAYINWSNVSTAYAFRYRKVGEIVWETVTPFHNSATLDNLSPDTEYEVQVASICEGLQGVFSDPKPFKTNAAPITPTCVAPATITVDNTTANGANASWSNTASSYRVRYKKVSEVNWVEELSSVEYWFTGGLTPNTDYDLQVASVCGDSQSSYASTIFKTSEEVVRVCDVPTDITSSNITSNSASITWDDNQSSTWRYVVNSRKILANGTTTSWAVQIVYSKSIDLTGLAANGEYEVRVAKHCRGNGTNIIISDFSPSITFRTLENANTAVSKVTNTIKLYPNPVVDVLNVTDVSDNTTYKIYNASGLEVSAGKINKNKINVSHLLQGTYRIMIGQGKDIFNSQFIKR